MRKEKKRRDACRYYLHTKIKELEPEDYELLNVKTREFKEKPKGKNANKLLIKYQYSIQLKLL